MSLTEGRIVKKYGDINENAKLNACFPKGYLTKVMYSFETLERDMFMMQCFQALNVNTENDCSKEDFEVDSLRQKCRLKIPTRKFRIFPVYTGPKYLLELEVTMFTSVCIKYLTVSIRSIFFNTLRY